MSEGRLVRRLLIRLGLVVIVAAALVSSRETFAHALLLESIPSAGATEASPPRLVLRFNGRIEKRLSRVVMVGGRDTRSIALDAPEASRADTLVYSLPVLATGSWEARWRVLSVDGHVTEGRVGFTVRQP